MFWSQSTVGFKSFIKVCAICFFLLNMHVHYSCFMAVNLTVMFYFASAVQCLNELEQ